MASAAASASRHWAAAPLDLIVTPHYRTKKTDVFTTGASHMALLHNSILRGYNSIYTHFSYIGDGDEEDFIGYCLTWAKFVRWHHDDESVNLFAKIEELLQDKTIFKNNDDEHALFLGGLTDFTGYLESLTSPSAFDKSELSRHMSSFNMHLQAHFHREIQTIADLADHPRAPKEGTPEAVAAAAIFKAWSKSIVTKPGLTDVAPFFLLNHDRTAEEGTWANWPPTFAPLKWGVANLGGARHSMWWRFSSCNLEGRPRELWALTPPYRAAK